MHRARAGQIIGSGAQCLYQSTSCILRRGGGVGEGRTGHRVCHVLRPNWLHNGRVVVDGEEWNVYPTAQICSILLPGRPLPASAKRLSIDSGAGAWGCHRHLDFLRAPHGVFCKCLCVWRGGGSSSAVPH